MLREDYVKDLVVSLQQVTYQMAGLEKQLSAVLEHSEEGQKTYYEAGYAILVKASVNYTLDKEEYEIIKNMIPSEFDFVKKSKKEVITYNIDKRTISNCKTYGSDELQYLIFGDESGENKKPLLKLKPRVSGISTSPPDVFIFT